MHAITLEQAAGLFKSLGEDSRIRILHLLFHKQELCVSDLEKVLNFTQTKTSRHLIYMKNAGLLYTRKKDQWVLYGIQEEWVALVQVLVATLQSNAELSTDLSTYQAFFAGGDLAICKMQEKNISKLRG